jgi:uncharacterized protein
MNNHFSSADDAEALKQHGFVPSRLLRFQIGFLLAEGKAHQAENTLDMPRIQVADDLFFDFLRGKLRFSRTSEGVLVQGLLHTQTVAECRRCLKDVVVPIEISLEELYIYPARPDAEFVVPETGVLDLAPLLREEAILSLPSGALCREDCAGLCLDCGQNFNDGQCDCADKRIDPRMASLKALRDQLSK